MYIAGSNPVPKESLLPYFPNNHICIVLLLYFTSYILNGMTGMLVIYSERRL